MIKLLQARSLIRITRFKVSGFIYVLAVCQFRWPCAFLATNLRRDKNKVKPFVVGLSNHERHGRTHPSTSSGRTVNVPP
jgi:hypothetical protein